MSSVEGSDKGEESLSEQQLDIFIKNNKVQKQRPNFRGSRNLHSEDSIYKQALKEYMFGLFDMASESCKKMIASNPQNPEPYFLMGTMHQEAATRNNDQAQLAKSVQYFFFHAYYSQPSEQKWLKVADMSKDLKLYQQAAYCYGRALKIKTNLSTFMQRAKCLEMCMQIKKAANIYKRIIQKFSNSAQVYKRYARLRFQREQYSKAREILISYPEHEKDWTIKYMIAETYQRQKKYVQLYYFICESMIKGSQQPINNIYEDLQIQIICMLFICRVACPEKTSQDIDINQMLQFLLKNYDQTNSTLYTQIISSIKQLNPQITSTLLKQLLKYSTHQTIQNYLYISEYLQKQGNYNEAIKYIQNGLSTKRCQNSAQLKTQLNYLKSLVKNKSKNKWENSGMSRSVVRQRNGRNGKDKGKNQEQEIFFSDEEVEKKQEEQSYGYVGKKEEQVSLFEDQESESDKADKPTKNKHKKIQKTRKTKSPTIHKIEAKDPQIISKLIKNNQLTLQSLKNEIESIRQQNNNNIDHISSALHRTFNDVQQCLGYLVEIQSSRQERTHFHRVVPHASQSIYNNREPKKRRMLGGGTMRRCNLISKNSSSLVSSLEYVIFFMKEYVKVSRYDEVVEFAQILSKAHFFKWQNKIAQFKTLKMQVYQIGVLACLQLKKYSKSIFFLRYLINKNPTNQFYLALAQKIMRLSTGKLFINKMLKKDIDTDLLSLENQPNRPQKQLVNIYYMTGLEYMQNCFFELAINMFTKVVSLLQSEQQQTTKQQQLCKTTYLCMTTCFLQISSSRTVFNKLDHINRSAYCLTQYKKYCGSSTQTQMLYNQARWYSYTRIFKHAIDLYERILSNSTDQQLIRRSALNLMIFYKELAEFDKVKELSQKYFGGGSQGRVEVGV